MPGNVVLINVIKKALLEINYFASVTQEAKKRGQTIIGQKGNRILIGLNKKKIN